MAVGGPQKRKEAGAAGADELWCPEHDWIQQFERLLDKDKSKRRPKAAGKSEGGRGTLFESFNRMVQCHCLLEDNGE